MTLRVPDRIANQLRQRSKAKGYSLNDTAVRALEQGLQRGAGENDGDDEWWRALGELLERPPLKKFDPEEFRRWRAEARKLPKTDSSIDDALNWMRQDRES